jgi:hypothetical protein
MRFRLLAFLLSGIVLGLSLPSFARDRPVLEYELEDQFRNVHTSSDILGSVVILIGSDKKGAEFNGMWGRAINARLIEHPHYDRVTNLGYANLKGVPFFLKSTIRGKFPQDEEAWVLMDWKGALFKSYGFVPKKANVLVFAPDGAFVHHAAGTEPTEDEVAELVDVVTGLLDEELSER